MTREKQIQVKMAGGGETYDTVVRPGDRPRDVLARTVQEQPDEYLLRRKIGAAFDDRVNVFEQVGEKEELISTSKPVVGISGW